MVIGGFDSERPDRALCARIMRLRTVMPDESPIDLDEHTAIIAYDVERQTRYPLRRREARIGVTNEYVQDVRHFLEEIRSALRR